MRSSRLSRVLATLIFPLPLKISTPPELKEETSKQDESTRENTRDFFLRDDQTWRRLHVGGEDVVLVDAGLHVDLHGHFIDRNIPLDGGLSRKNSQISTDFKRTRSWFSLSFLAFSSFLSSHKFLKI